MPSWCANYLIGKITGVKVHDYGCSLKLYRASVIKQVKLMGEMHRFIPAWVAGVVPSSRIGEMAVNHHSREFGQSKYGISRTFRVILDLLSVLFFMRYKARPGHFFGSIGLGFGAFSGVHPALSRLSTSSFFGNDIGTRPMLIDRRHAVSRLGAADHHGHARGNDGADLFRVQQHGELRGPADLQAGERM